MHLRPNEHLPGMSERAQVPDVVTLSDDVDELPTMIDKRRQAAPTPNVEVPTVALGGPPYDQRAAGNLSNVEVPTVTLGGPPHDQQAAGNLSNAENEVPLQ